MGGSFSPNRTVAHRQLWGGFSRSWQAEIGQKGTSWVKPLNSHLTADTPALRAQPHDRATPAFAAFAAFAHPEE
jgi:hypothetical protein